MQYKSVVVVEYDSRWPQLYETEAVLLQSAVGDSVLHHIGSTAVPSLSAKPIIDIMIGICPAHDVILYIDIIESLGYLLIGDGGRENHLFFVKSGAQVYYLHLLHNGSLEYNNQLLVRDVLRSDALLCREYAELKQQLAVFCAEDVITYRMLKAPFIRRLIDDHKSNSVQQEGEVDA